MCVRDGVSEKGHSDVWDIGLLPQHSWWSQPRSRMTVTHTLVTPMAARARSRTLQTDAGWTQTQRLQMYQSHAELQARVSCRTMPGLCGTSVIFRLAVMHMHALMDLYTHTHTNIFLYNSIYISGAALQYQAKNVQRSKHDLGMNGSVLGSGKGQGPVGTHPCYPWEHNISGKQMSNRIIKVNYCILYLSCHNVVQLLFWLLLISTETVLWKYMVIEFKPWIGHLCSLSVKVAHVYFFALPEV